MRGGGPPAIILCIHTHALNSAAGAPVRARVVAPATVADAQTRGAADTTEAAGGAAPCRLAVGGRRALGARGAPELRDERCREQQRAPLQGPPRHGVVVRIGEAPAGADHIIAEAGAVRGCYVRSRRGVVGATRWFADRGNAATQRKRAQRQQPHLRVRTGPARGRSPGPPRTRGRACCQGICARRDHPGQSAGLIGARCA
jgi:hypothetical protein